MYDIKACMPPGSKEPEPKLLVPRPKCFESIRAIFSSKSNAFMIPEQMYVEKNPLVSALLDTCQNGNPTAFMAANERSLRLRFEIDPRTKKISKLDFNEKTSMVSSEVIGGIPNRDEREREIEIGEDLEEGYEAFKEKYRSEGDPAFCDNVKYDDLKVFSGYIAARTEYGFAVKHPNHPILMIFEACEDRFDVLDETLCNATASFFEFEFEPRQVIGKIPKYAETPEGFQAFLYSSMTAINQYLDKSIAGSTVNNLSKAEIARDHTIYQKGDCSFIESLGISPVFNKAGQNLCAEQYALMMGSNPDECLEEALSSLIWRAGKMHNEKLNFNENFTRPHTDFIGSGTNFLPFEMSGKSSKVPFPFMH